MTRIAVFFVTYVLSLTITHAASSQWVTSGDTKMRLIAIEPMDFNKTIWAALEVQLAPGWKTYWENPSETGVPLRVDITKSSNATLKKLHFPTPKWFDDKGESWAGYDAPVVFPIELERENFNLDSQIEADVFIGLCNKICVPFEAKFTVNLDAKQADKKELAQVVRAFQKVPKLEKENLRVLSAELEDEKIIIYAVDKQKYFDDKGYAMLDCQDCGGLDLFFNPSGRWLFGKPELTEVNGDSFRYEAKILQRDKVLPYIYYVFTSKFGMEDVSGRIQVKKNLDK